MLATIQLLSFPAMQGQLPWLHSAQSHSWYRQNQVQAHWPPEMYRASPSTRDHVNYHGASLKSCARQEQWNRSDLVHALKRGEFVPYFQPKVDFGRGVTCQTETLARWRHPDLGVLPPSQFIEQMVSEGLIGQLTEALLHELLANMRDTAARDADIGYAINVSAVTLESARACDRLRSIVKEYGIAAERITIELTETAAVHDFETLLASLIRFRDEGFEISADDFGKGYSTLEQLHRIPFTEIKIDQMFVASLLGNKRSMAILESIVHLAGILGLHTVAEGIETLEQLMLVKSTGCEAGQGYYFAKPMSHPDLLNYLQSTSCAVAH